MKIVVHGMAVAIALSAMALGASAAAAAEVKIAPVTYSADFQKAMDETYGAREGEVLTRYIEKKVRKSLATAGAASDPGVILVEITLEDAKPNRPTMREMQNKPGLSMQSIAIGGAQLSAKLTTRTGVQTITYGWFESDITQVIAANTWSDAQRAIRRFADEVAEAYAESASAAPAPNS
jgi:hypothetical protein